MLPRWVHRVQRPHGCLYMQHFRTKSKCLVIYSDCSYSGKWVIACREFGVQPCGHSAKKTGFLLKVGTSCKSFEIPYTLLYSARGRGNDKNTGTPYFNYNCEVEQDQHTSDIDSTEVTCKNGASIEDPCLLVKDYTGTNNMRGRE